MRRMASQIRNQGDSWSMLEPRWRWLHPMKWWHAAERCWTSVKRIAQWLYNIIIYYIESLESEWRNKHLPLSSPVGSDMGHGSDPLSVWSLHVLWIVGQGNCAKPGWATRPLRFSPQISYVWSCFWTDPCTPLVQHVLHLQRMRANVLGLSGWLYRTLRARRPVLLPLGWTWAWRLSQLSRVVPKVWTAGLQAAKWPELIVFHNTPALFIWKTHTPQWLGWNCSHW